jgi:hypothetical protein
MLMNSLDRRACTIRLDDESSVAALEGQAADLRCHLPASLAVPAHVPR